MTKAVLLDTSVLIHDPTSMTSFEDDTEVLIPIYVIMELDVLKDTPKREKSHVAHLARQASNLILELQPQGKVKVVSHDGEISIRALDRANQIRYVDLLILQTAIHLKDDYDLTLVSRDINLRIICESVGVKSEDFTSDTSTETLSGIGLKEFVPDVVLMNQLVKSYWQGAVRLPHEFDVEFHENQYAWFLAPGEKKHLFQHKEGSLFNVDKVRTERAKPRNLEQRAALDALLDQDIELVCLLGKAGTGKTFLALAAALEQAHTYQRILLSKPVVDVGKGIGFLPGSLSEKLEPWMQSFFDNLDQINPLWDAGPMGGEMGTKEGFLEKNQIEIQPIHSIRGRSLKQAFMIIDEAQNLTKHEIKSIITRAAEGTKVVLLGDPYQIDHPYLTKQSNGLVYVIERMLGQPLFACVSLHKSERSTLSDIAADLL
jgi:PhoH-like ATPase